jgi:hypothetical protein
MLPPSQCELCQLQSVSSCSLKTSRSPVMMAVTASTAAVVEYAQQLPHAPWFLTGVRMERQSTEADTLRFVAVNPHAESTSSPARPNRHGALSVWNWKHTGREQ